VAPESFVAPRQGLQREALAWFRLGPADRALVAVGDGVDIDQPIIERGRDVSVVEVRAARGAQLPDPGSWYEGTRDDVRGRPLRTPVGVVLFHTPDGRIRVAVARYRDTFGSPVAGTIESVDAAGVSVRTTGTAISGIVAWGQAVSGPLVVAVPDPDAELRSSAVDVGAAGSVLVAGARLDIEALTRARAIGVRGIVTGGLVGKELRQLEASDARQRAGLHTAAPFGLVVLDGYGRRPIPGPFWDRLRSAEGRSVGLVMDPPMIVLDIEPEPASAPSMVRIAAGDEIGVQGPLLGLAGPVRRRAGLYQPSGIMGVAPSGDDDAAARRIVPAADLERFQ
jgi:hypothetical protein